MGCTKRYGSITVPGIDEEVSINDLGSFNTEVTVSRTVRMVIYKGTLRDSNEFIVYVHLMTMCVGSVTGFVPGKVGVYPTEVDMVTLDSRVFIGPTRLRTDRVYCDGGWGWWIREGTLSSGFLLNQQ